MPPSSQFNWTMMNKWTSSAAAERLAPSPKNDHRQLKPPPATHPTTAKADKFADLSASHDDLEGLSEENLAEYTSLLVAFLRAGESKRDDAIINDPYAEILAGEAGGAMLAFSSKWSMKTSQLSDYIALRTRAIDEALAHRDAAIQQVVILGAGLDTRAYRLETLANCHVIEIDICQRMMDRKARVLEDTGAQLVAKQHHVIIADLAQDAWQTELVAVGFDEKAPTFWLLEGLLYYMEYDSNVRMVKTLDALSSPGSQLWADISGMKLKGDDGEGLFKARALKYGENDPMHGVVSLLKWDMEITARFDRPMELYGREWTPIRCSESEEAVPCFFVSALKPQDTSNPPLM